MSRNWLAHIIFSPIDAITEEALAHLTGDELEAVCLVLGIPHSGLKSEQIQRILTAKELRIELARWVHSELNPFDYDACMQVASVMSENYKGKQLRNMCRKAKVFAPSTKGGMCSSLINWVLSCRRKGKQVLKEYRAAVKKRNKPKQLTLFPVYSSDFKTVYETHPSLQMRNSAQHLGE